jgi:hypothetical protein
MTRYLIPRWSLHHGEPLTTLTAYSMVEAAEQLPIGARLVAISKDLTVWEHADVEYQVPRRCIRAVVGSYRNATLKIGEML